MMSWSMSRPLCMSIIKKTGVIDMEKRTKAIMKASVCIIVVMAMGMPSAIATIKNELLSVVVCSNVIDRSEISDECTGSPQYIVVHGLVCGVTRTVVFGQNTEQFSYTPDGDPPDSGACGLLESKNHVGYASSFPWVHTYNEHIPPPIYVTFIYAPLFMSELRVNRTKAYLVFPGIEYKQDLQDDTWSNCPILGGALVWETARFGYTYIGSFGFGKGNLDDHVYPFRTKLTFWDEVARGYDSDGNLWVRFVKGGTVVSGTGLWFADQYPYTKDVGVMTSTHIQSDAEIN